MKSLRKSLTSFAVIMAIASTSLFASNIDDVFIQGPLAGKIKSYEAQGYQVTHKDVNYVAYFWIPQPPYQYANISIILQKNVHLGGGVYSRSVIWITAEAWVINDNGNIVIKNLTDSLREN